MNNNGVKQSTADAAKIAMNKAGWTINSDRKKAKNKPAQAKGTPEERQKLLDKNIADFKKAGGKIDVIPNGISGIGDKRQIGMVISSKNDTIRPVFAKRKD